MKEIKLSIFIIFTLFINSCGLYTPTSINTPLLKEKGEAKIGAQLLNGVDVQAAYAVTNSIGIMANYQYLNYSYNYINKRSLDQYFKQYGTNKIGEIGLGYFKTEPSLKKYYATIVKEIYGGIGLGNFKIHQKIKFDNKTNNNFSSPFYYKHYVPIKTYFLQGNVGKRKNKNEISVGTRFTIMNYGTAKSTIPDSLFLNSKLNNFLYKNHFYLEPNLTFKTGFKHIKVQSQLIFVIPRTLGYSVEDYTKFLLNFGIIASIGPFKK